MDSEPLTIEMLESWVLAGAHWRVLEYDKRRTVVELQQCTGERVDVLESQDPALIAYLDGVESDLDLIVNGDEGVCD